jgi:predicted Zn-ribbon and HTH transcriptional regulator
MKPGNGEVEDHDEDSGGRKTWRNEPIEPPRTVRQQITELLLEQEMSAKELSRRLGVREKEIYAHLGHIAKSVAARGKKLQVPPFECLSCGYVFRGRERFTRPGRCPRCRESHIQTPVYRLG